MNTNREGGEELVTVQNALAYFEAKLLKTGWAEQSANEAMEAMRPILINFDQNRAQALKDAREEMERRIQIVIAETSPERVRSFHDTVVWIANYLWKKANPKSKFNEPPSMVYEQVEKDYGKFLTEKP